MNVVRHLVLALLVVAAAGCQQAARQELATLRPSPIASSPAASARSSAGPSEQPSPAPGDVAISKFVDLVTTGKFSYRSKLDGTASGAVNTLTVTGSLDVSGPNYALTVTWKFPDGVSDRNDLRLVGDRLWSRWTGTDWQELKGFLEEDTNSPFAFVESESDVELVEAVKVEGKQRFKVRVDDARIVDPSYIPAANLSNTSTRKATFDVLLDPNGRPISGYWELTGVGRVSGQLQEIEIRLDVTFSKVGKPVTIRRP